MVSLLIDVHNSRNRWVELYHPMITLKLITVTGLNGTLRIMQYVMLQFSVFLMVVFINKHSYFALPAKH